MSAAEAIMPPKRAGDIVLRLSIGRDVKPSPGTPHDHKPARGTADEFASSLAKPEVGPKGSAGFYLPAVFATGRRTKNDSIAPPCLVSVDLDFGAWSIEKIRAVVPEGIGFFTHSTASHTPESPRYRVGFPIAEPLSVDRWVLLSRGVMRWFGYEEGTAAFDKCTERIAQPMYLPTISAPDAPFEFASELDVPAMSVEIISDLIDDEETREKAAEEEARIEREHLSEARRQKAKRFGNDTGANVIEAFNAAHPIGEMLEGCAYIPPRAPNGRYLSPNSSKGIPAVKVWHDEGRFYSHHAGDQGTPVEFGDAFDLFVHYKHGGDWNAAIRAAAEDLGIDHRSRRAKDRARTDDCGANPIARDEPGSEEESEDTKAGPANAADFFDREFGFVPERMGKELERECAVIVGEGGRLYRFDKGVYRPDAEEWIASRVRQILGKRFKRRHREETLAWFKSSMPVDTTTPPADYLNVSNGLLRWDDLTLEPHRHSVVTTVQIPIAWKPGAGCPGILAFLRDVLPDEETVQFVLEVIGYALCARNLFHVAVLLRGPGRNGKSVLLKIIVALLGEESVAAVPLQQFSENRFAAASLVGKLANICGDLDARAIKRTDVFKMLTGGDRIYTERKYGQAFSFTSFALPIFSANEPPLSADQSEAWFERWLVVPMDKTIPPEKRDPDLAEKLRSQAELEGLLVVAVAALKRLLARGRFELPGSIREAQAEYRERLDSVSSFIESECCFGPNGSVSRRDLAAAYKAHCRDLELHAVGAARLYERITQADSGVVQTALRGVRGFKGVSLR